MPSCDSLGPRPARHTDPPGSRPPWRTAFARAAARTDSAFDLARVQAALEAVGVGVWEFDPDTGETRRSGAYDAIYGYPAGFPGSWNTGTCLSHVHPEDRPGVEAAWAAAIARREAMHLTYRILRGDDGAVRWVEAHGMPSPEGGAGPLRYLGTLADITDRREEDQQREVILGEMRHRVKNILANVQSLALQTGRRAHSVEDFLQVFGGRLGALAQAHDLSMSQPGGGIELGTVIRAALDPWGRDDRLRCRVMGEQRISSRQAVALSLALHELATNAVKYGALSVPRGSVAIEAGGPAGAPVTVRWTEMGGPPPPAGCAQGFGTRLLCQALPKELGGSLTLAFPPEGARCEMRFDADAGPVAATGAHAGH